MERAGTRVAMSVREILADEIRRTPASDSTRMRIPVVLDSFEKREESDPTVGRFQFDLVLGHPTRESRQIGMREVPSNITSIEIASFPWPTLEPVAYTLNIAGTSPGLPVLIMNTADASAAERTQLPFGSVVSAELLEMTAQGAAMRRGRAHFEFRIADGLARPVDDRDALVLAPGTPSLDRVSLVFRNPEYPVMFGRDCLYGAKAYVGSSSQIRFEYAGHGLNAGDRIFVGGFVSGISVIDTYITRAEGLNVGTGGLTTDTFFLNPHVGVGDLGSVADGISVGTYITIYVAKNRIRIPIVIECNGE